MTKKKSFYVGALLLGACILVAGIVLHVWMGEEVKKWTGICLGVGMSLISMSVVNLIMKRKEEKNPEWGKQNKIEYNDERNAYIRYKAKAKAGDYMQWGVAGIAYITIATNSPLWVTMVVMGVFLLYCILEAFYIFKYQEEL